MFEQYTYKRGALVSPPDDRDYSLHIPMAAVLPARHIPPTLPAIGKQAHSNCTAWAASYAYETSQKKVYSKGYLYGEREPTEYQGQGRYLRDILKSALNHGNVLYPIFPREYEVTSAQWEVRNRQEELRKAAAPYKIKAYAKLANANEVKQAIMSGMGVIFSAACSHLKASAKGILPMNEPNYGHHCMAIIGWDDNYEGNAYAYCPQSWGTGFGLNGFCYVSWTDIMRDGDVWAMTFADDDKTDPTKPYIRRTLRKGMEGDDVQELQGKLIALGYDLGKWGADGDFGSATDNAVRKFQKDRKLKVDGLVGQKTREALNGAPAPVEPIPTPSTVREKLLAKVFTAGAALIGSNYSQDDRNKLYPGGYFDCSSFVHGIYAAAGFPLLSTNGAELRVSNAEVDAAGFDLVYPATRNQIGKTLPSPAGLLSSYGAQPGDIVFFNLKSTTRANKITHVAMIDRDGKQLIQTANNSDKCTREPLTKYDKRICAIIRLQQKPVMPALPELVRGEKNVAFVRTLQIALNIWRGERLVCDGIFGSKTGAAVAKVNAELGVTSEICTGATWSTLLEG